GLAAIRRRSTAPLHRHRHARGHPPLIACPQGKPRRQRGEGHNADEILRNGDQEAMTDARMPPMRYRIPRALLLTLTQSRINVEALATDAGLHPRRLFEPVPVIQRNVFLARAASKLPPGSGLGLGVATAPALLGLTGLA